jgi:hypothetical protein
MKKFWSIILDPLVNPATPIVLDDGLIRVYCPTDIMLVDTKVETLVTYLNLAMEIKNEFNS